MNNTTHPIEWAILAVIATATAIVTLINIATELGCFEMELPAIGAMKVADLRQLARALEIKGAGKMRKADLLLALA